jgi:YVTN family beta-propeller protein
VTRAGVLVAASLVVGCSSSTAAPRPVVQPHSSTIAVSPDGAHLYVVHPDADCVTVLSTGSRTIERTVMLANSAPAVDATTGRYQPSIAPRALALDSDGRHLYVTGERSGLLYAIDTANGAVTASRPLCSEPIGVLVSPDDAEVFVACSQDDEVLEVDAASLTLKATVVTPREPWALGWAPDGHTLLVTHLLGPGVSALATDPLALTATWPLADGPPGSDPTVAHGVVRGIYDVVARPGSSEIWTAHMMLGIDTVEPALVFDDTVFPSVSIFDPRGDQLARLSVSPANGGPGSGGAFGDVTSGPRSVTFSDDGKTAFVIDTDSEDVLVVDPVQRVELTVVRPLPGHMPEGAVWRDGELYVQERNTEDVAVFRVQQGPLPQITPDGAPIKSLASDPMPADMRLGQKLFYSANSDDVPTTQDHWVSCATCHVEGRSDAVTWLFTVGPRDTPSNGGGTLDTGFLMHTADRSKVQDYWQTIDVEQGGHFAAGGPQEPLLDALEAYVDHAIPVPVAPSTDATHSITGAALATLRSQGEAVFERVGCPLCHHGPAKTDSGDGNPTLDLSGPVLLHDVGTCVTTGPDPDAAHEDIDGNPRQACAFDTPALRGLADSAPYLHDGSAATLGDVLPSMLLAGSQGGAAQVLDAADTEALVEYLRSL